MFDEAIFSDPEFGPVFGKGHDLCIGNNANTQLTVCHSLMGNTYSVPENLYTDEDIANYLGGNATFGLTEIEVFKVCKD